MPTLKIDLDAERASVTEYYRLWHLEKIHLDNMLRECNEQKNTPPPNYWHAEHTAKRKYENARDALECLLAIYLTSRSPPS